MGGSICYDDGLELLYRRPVKCTTNQTPVRLSRWAGRLRLVGRGAYLKGTAPRETEGNQMKITTKRKRSDHVYCYGWRWSIRNQVARLVLRRFWSQAAWQRRQHQWNFVDVSSAPVDIRRGMRELRSNVNGPDEITIRSQKA
jgi:hypothetical protein